MWDTDQHTNKKTFEKGLLVKPSRESFDSIGIEHFEDGSVLIIKEGCAIILVEAIVKYTFENEKN